MHARELAKFASGIAFHETLGHWWLGTFGSWMLPWKIGSFTFTSELNMICMAAWPLIFGVLVYVGWFGGSRRESLRTIGA
jgi:hypothetical protein